jgi:hypothetical protein
MLAVTLINTLKVAASAVLDRVRPDHRRARAPRDRTTPAAAAPASLRRPRSPAAASRAVESGYERQPYTLSAAARLAAAGARELLLNAMYGYLEQLEALARVVEFVRAG